MGELLAAEAPVDADLVISVPDSGNPMANGFARASGLPKDDGLIKNRYVQRTFIQPGQELRKHGLRMKFNPLPEIVAGKRVVVVDDSIVRGNTTRQIVAMLKEAGATEVHLRISAPPIRHPCHYGIDMSTREEMIAHDRTEAEIAAELGADSLAYLSMDAVYEAIGTPREKHCDACFTGDYPLGDPEGANGKFALEEIAVVPGAQVAYRRDVAFRIAVLASGAGTNLQAILDQLHGRDGIEVVGVASDKPRAEALERARAAGVETAVFPAADHRRPRRARPRDRRLADGAGGRPGGAGGLHAAALASVHRALPAPDRQRAPGPAALVSRVWRRSQQALDHGSQDHRGHGPLRGRGGRLRARSSSSVRSRCPPSRDWDELERRDPRHRARAAARGDPADRRGAGQRRSGEPTARGDRAVAPE